MTNECEKLGHGWILKKAKLRRTYIIRPFILFRQDAQLAITVEHDLIFFRHSRTIQLKNLHVCPLRNLTHAEFSEVVRSKLAPTLPDDFRISSAYCFDIWLDQPGRRRSLTVIGKFVDTVANVHRVMSLQEKPMNVAEYVENCSLEGLLGSTVLSTPLLDIEEDEV